MTHRVPVTTLRTGVVINTSSGSCDDKSSDTLRQLLENAGIAPESFHCVQGAQVEAAIDAALKDNIQLLVVLGGDGTIRTAATRCGTADVGLVPLPGGTMNMLPHALYGEKSWQEVLPEILANPVWRQVSSGSVEGHRFFCAAIFGSPALWARAREAVRANRLLAAWRRARLALQQAFSSRLRYRFDQTLTGSAMAVTLICPLISQALDNDAGRLEAAALDLRGAEDAFQLAVTSLFSGWRSDPRVKTIAAQRIVLTARRALPAILDGEIVSLSASPTIVYEANGFRALVMGAAQRPD